MGQTFTETLSFVTRQAAVQSSLSQVDPSVSIVSEEAFARNYNQTASFNLSTPNITWKGVKYPASSMYISDGFVINLTSPENSSIGLDGNERVEFEVVPLRYSLNREPDGWIADNTSGGIILFGPFISSTCDVRCIDGTGRLQFWQSEQVSGIVEYEVRLLGSDVTQIFSIDVQMVNELFGAANVTVIEDQTNISFPEWTGVRNSPGPKVLPNASFPITFIRGDDIFLSTPTVVVSGTNQGELNFDLRRDASGSALLNVEAIYTNPDSFGWSVKSLNFTVSVLPVNDPPTFFLNCSSSEQFVQNCSTECDGSVEEFCGATVVVEQNCADCDLDSALCQGDDCRCFVLDRFIAAAVPYNASYLQALANPDAASSAPEYVPEWTQNMTFVVRLVNATDTLFDEGFDPQIDVSTSALSFCLAPDKHGVALFEVYLVDSGGVALGGYNRSSSMFLTTVVRYVNQEPSFDVSVPSTIEDFEQCVTCSNCTQPDCVLPVLLWENSGAMIVDPFAVDVLRGNPGPSGMDLEAFQNITFFVSFLASEVYGFSVDNYDQQRSDSQLFLDGSTPVVSADGILTFEFEKFAHGLVSYDIVMADSGGTMFSGINVSAPRNLTILAANSYLHVVLRLPRSIASCRSQNQTLLPALCGAAVRAFGTSPGEILFCQNATDANMTNSSNASLCNNLNTNTTEEWTATPTAFVELAPSTGFPGNWTFLGGGDDAAYRLSLPFDFCVGSESARDD
eukprot:634135-Rhodomonas_salina.1